MQIVFHSTAMTRSSCDTPQTLTSVQQFSFLLGRAQSDTCTKSQVSLLPHPRNSIRDPSKATNIHTVTSLHMHTCTSIHMHTLRYSLTPSPHHTCTRCIFTPSHKFTFSTSHVCNFTPFRRRLGHASDWPSERRTRWAQQVQREARTVRSFDRAGSRGRAGVGGRKPSDRAGPRESS